MVMLRGEIYALPPTSEDPVAHESTAAVTIWLAAGSDLLQPAGGRTLHR
jgi:hypothetical protein